MIDRSGVIAAEAQQRTLAETFASAIKSQDAELLRSVTTKNVTWSLPGNSIIGGDAQGVTSMLRRSQLLADFGVDINLLHLVYGRRGFGFLLHNTGSRLGRVLDEHLTRIFQTEGPLIGQLDT